MQDAGYQMHDEKVQMAKLKVQMNSKNAMPKQRTLSLAEPQRTQRKSE